MFVNTLNTNKDKDNPNAAKLSATRLLSKVRAEVCEARDGEAMSFGGQGGDLTTAT